MNYLHTAIKFIKRNRVFSVINILGLSMALSISFLLLLYIINELSFDTTHENAEQVYRVVNDYKDFEKKISGTPYPLAEDLKAHFPQVEEAVNVRFLHSFFLKVGEEKMWQRGLATSSGLFDIFTIPILARSKAREELLASPYDMVISEKVAQATFQGENPLGKAITVFFDGEERVFNVVAVCEDLPPNSSLRADCFVNSQWSLPSINQSFNIDNAHANYQLDLWVTWMKLVPGADTEALTKEFPSFLEAHSVDTDKRGYTLQNLKRYHLYSSHIENSRSAGDWQGIKITGIIVLLVLLVSSFNYITLSTAISTNRAKEIGIRKTNGAAVALVRRQLMSESLLVALTALPIAVLLMYGMRPHMESLLEMNLPLIGSNGVAYLLVFLMITLLIGLLSGLYSSFYLAKLDPIAVMNKKFFEGKKKNRFRSALIVFQLTIFCLFVASVFIIRSQYRYAMQKDLGYRTSHILFVNLNEEEDAYRRYLARVKSLPGVRSAAGSMDALPMMDMSSFVVDHFVDSEKKVELEGMDVDYNYLETMGIKLHEGRFFSEAFGSDLEQAIILNREAVKRLGLTDPIGKKIMDKTIVGVTEDFILHSIHFKTAPLAIELIDKYIFQMAIHYEEGALEHLLPALKKEWKEVYGTLPFSFVTPDEIKREIYSGEQNLVKLILVVSLFTLLIAVLGLLGTTLFITRTRIKEIGIRKVMGSSRRGVIFLLIKEGFFQVLVAFLVATPLSFLLMSEWLMGYAYRVKINLWLFVFTGFMALAVVMLTLLSQAYSAAGKNPVEALRYE
ncbi:MAG: hypothetical protein CSA95_02495 [Bacteroidetes bacterium]|nr:MAG: hypothetical protein CSA95_02495 [Bacteroidota bacterium]